MSVQDQLREIQGRISIAQSKKTRAEVEEENAMRRLTEAKTALRDEYGVTTKAEIDALEAQLKKDLEDHLQEIQKALEESGA